MIDRFGGPSDFNMPWMNARADLIGAQLLLGDFSPIERTWEATWEDALASEAWERWLVSGRLAANRAELEFGLGRFDDAVTWSRRARELAIRGRRRKYEANASITLGRRSRARDVEARRPSSARPSRCRTSWGRRSRVGRLAPRSWRWSGRRREATPRGTP